LLPQVATPGRSTQTSLLEPLPRKAGLRPPGSMPSMMCCISDLIKVEG